MVKRWQNKNGIPPQARKKLSERRPNLRIEELFGNLDDANTLNIYVSKIRFILVYIWTQNLVETMRNVLSAKCAKLTESEVHSSIFELLAEREESITKPFAQWSARIVPMERNLCWNTCKRWSKIWSIRASANISTADNFFAFFMDKRGLDFYMNSRGWDHALSSTENRVLLNLCKEQYQDCVTSDVGVSAQTVVQYIMKVYKNVT